MEKYFQKLRDESRIEFEVFLDLGKDKRSVLLKSASGDPVTTSISLPERTSESLPETNQETKSDSKPFNP
jgi:hypothetical protein